MVAVTPLLLWIGVAPAAKESCAARSTPDAWAQVLDQAEAAFAALDQAAFEARLALAAQELPCLSAPVFPALAARYHRLVGLDQFVRRDEEGARLAFAAARAVDPLGVLPAELLPPGHVARALSESASTPGETQPLWCKEHTVLWFDGIPGTNRPVDRDTLVQIEIAGQVETGHYLTPADPLPPGLQSRSAHRGLLWLAGGLGLALGGAAVGAVVALP